MPRGGPLAAKVRAARAYADLDQGQLAGHMGWSVETQARVERGARPLSTDELARLLDATDLPAEFFRIDFSTLPDLVEAEATRDDLRAELRALREGLQSVRARVTLLEAAGTQPSAGRDSTTPPVQGAPRQ